MTEFVNNMPDCLVFKFEEVEKGTKKVDTTVYVVAIDVRIDGCAISIRSFC